MRPKTGRIMLEKQMAGWINWHTDKWDKWDKWVVKSKVQLEEGRSKAQAISIRKNQKQIKDDIKTIQRTKQVTRGHNIVTDGWAGAANPHPHPTSFPTRTH